MAATSLLRGFKHPPASARPWVFWMWLRVQTNRAAITADLQAMHAQGIAGAILYDSGVGGGMEATQRMVPGTREYRLQPTDDFRTAHFTPLPQPPMPSWQPASRELVRFAASEAARFGIRLVLTVGLAGTSGDIALQDSQQRLVWSQAIVTGDAAVTLSLPPPGNAIPASRVPVQSMVPERADVGAHPAEQHSIAVLAIPAGGMGPAGAINLSGAVDAAGVLRWHAPAGEWRIFRFSYEPTHMANAWGLYTDAMSATALDHTWDATVGALLREMSPEELRGLYGVEDDSWEAGVSTWTADFPAQFQRRRGYSLLPWLPALAGAATTDAAQAQGIRRDFYRTVADLIAENHYAHLAELAHRNRLRFYSETAGPNSGELDVEQNGKAVDVPMGEFWMPSQHRPTPDRRFLVHNAASSAHVYGHGILACEGFTSVGPHWEESLFDLKNTADQGFTEGCNSIVIHNFSQSPTPAAKPGYVYFAGTHYDRGTTWWSETPAFNAYLGRTSFLLQQGHFAADLLYYRGDGIGQLEQHKTAIPVDGYAHDNINLDGLLHRLSVRQGRLTLPDGTGYRMLVLPDDARIAPKALARIERLVEAGAVIVGQRPREIDGFSRSPEDARAFQRRVARLWPVSPASGSRSVSSQSPAAVLRSLHLAPDLRFQGVSSVGEVDWTHRSTGMTDIYFIASRWDRVEQVQATFRVHGRQPELWDAVTGTVRPAVAFRQHDGLTTVPLTLNPRGAIFVVFRRRVPAGRNGTATSNSPAVTPLQTVNGPWTIFFDPAWGGPGNITFPTLVDWSTRPEEGIRHYSGIATYRTGFTLAALPSPGTHLLLDLGTVHEEAHVRVNGQDLGTVWTKPAQVDITAAVRQGTNQLQVDVVNLWPNRLIGDEALPDVQRFTLTNAHKFGVPTPLLPSGLLGPVKLLRR